MGTIVLVLGLLPAWIANQPVQALLFGALGAVSAYFSGFLEGRRVRLLIFVAAGLLIGAIPSLFVAPMVAFVCGILGMMIGLMVAFPASGQLFSNITMRVMDIILTFPGYLLAIAIVSFLGPGIEKGMIAIGIVSIPIYARLARSAVL